MRSRVVLPQPLEPTKTVVVRDGMTRLKSSTALVPSGYVLRTERNSIMWVPFCSEVARLRTSVPRIEDGVRP